MDERVRAVGGGPAGHGASLSVQRARRWMLAAAAAGLLLRLAFGLFYWIDKPLTHDEREYLALARSLTEGRGFSYEPAEPAGTSPRFGRAPGYPVFLAIVGAGRSAHESSPTVVKVVQAFVGAAGVWLIGLVALRALGPRAGVAAAALAAVYPPLVWIPAYVLTETLFSAVALLAAVVLQRAVAGPTVQSEEGGRTRAYSAAGVLTGIAILVRPAMLFYLPLVIVWLFARKQRASALVCTAAAVLVVTPWTVRNWMAYDRFVLVASEGGVTFWTGNHPLARGEGDLAANPELKAAELRFRAAHPDLTPEELEPLYYEDAFRWIRAHPGQWLILLARKAFFTVVPIGPSYTLHSTKYFALSVCSYVAVLLLAMAGFGRIWRSDRRPTAVLLLAASAVLASLVFFPQERFRIPVIDPVLIISAAALARVEGEALA